VSTPGDTVTFEFNGKSVDARPGGTVVSALYSFAAGELVGEKAAAAVSS